MRLPVGSLVVFDRGYTDYSWYQVLIESGVFFVARLKDNALVEYFKKRPSRKTNDVILDEEIALKDIKVKLRLVQLITQDGKKIAS